MSAASIGVLPTPVEAAATLHATTLSSTSPIFDLVGECKTIATLTVKLFDPYGETSAKAASSMVVSVDGNGSARVAPFTRLGRSGRFVSYRAKAIFCGIGNSREQDVDAAGAHRWSFRFSTTGSDVIGSRNMFVRLLGNIDFNASPEPVNRGGKVKLVAYLWDGWEDSYPGRITFYFKADGSSRYVRVASATTTCAGEPDIYLCQVKRFVKQSRSGTWRAYTPGGRWFSSAVHDDHVSVV